MNNFNEAAQMARDVDLHCPRCGAHNAPRRTYISPEPHAQAVCSVCSYAGPLATFQLPKTMT